MSLKTKRSKLMANIIDQLDELQMQSKSIPDFSAGDTDAV